ncbi:MAG: hypothetical protein IJH58_05830, partial [Clostridia bacterium]|nr:hypothetical protein [Clostridia bacterium]
MEQSRNIRNGSGATGRHISTDAAINQKKAAQKKSAAAKRRSKKAVNSVKQAAKKPASKKTSSGKANNAAKRPANRQAPAKQSPNARKQTSNAKKQQNAKRNAQLQNARANGQKKQATRKKKKYKVNYRRLITCIVAALLVFLLLFLIIHAIAHKGSKKGWYNVYVTSATSDCRLGRVTELDENGVPAKVDLLEEVKDGVYLVPVQCGGTSTIIVADKDYSFNKVNPYNTEYYLASVQAEYSSDAAKQAEFEDKYQPSIVEVEGQTITTSG